MNNKLSERFFQRDVLDSGEKPEYITAPRVGIDYAKEWKDIEWRFILKKTLSLIKKPNSLFFVREAKNLLP